MISHLTQERLLGAALGSVFVGAVVFEQRRGIYEAIAANVPSDAVPYQAEEIVPKRDYTLELARIWNKAVDQTLGSLVVYLSSRRW